YYISHNLSVTYATLAEYYDKAEQDYKKAAEYYQKAVDRENTSVAKRLAEMYEKGQGVGQDRDRAKKLRARKTDIRRYTVPCLVNGTQRKVPFHIYIFEEWVQKENPLESQDRYLQDRGLTIPKDVVDSFKKLAKIARDNKVSFTALCDYALSQANKDDKS